MHCRRAGGVILLGMRNEVTDMTLDEVNAATMAELVVALGAIFEHAPWVAEQAAAARPFATIAALHEAMVAVVLAAPEATQLAFLRGHPELGGAAARGGQMAAHSIAEQQALGLDTLADDRAAEIQGLNAAYLERFGFPFILCVTRHTRASILANFRRRLENARDVELQTALAEIAMITRLRLVALVHGAGAPVTQGRVSTHVLDTAAGQPGAGIKITLFEIDGDRAIKLSETVTNGDGRTDAPLMGHAPLRIGVYEVRFEVGAYFGSAPGAFLDVIPVRFGITEAEAHYHVPLLVSPYAYSTYRGS
jgi:2-oxo-4-hydroxy-4-carboxy-5-ureidoimidazoline decarboxylase